MRGKALSAHRWPPGMPLHPRLVLGLGCLFLLVLGAPRIVRQVRDCVMTPADVHYMTDFAILTRVVDNFSKTGVLYDTTGRDPYGPVTRSMLKYPPPHAAFIMAMISDARSDSLRWAEVRAQAVARGAKGPDLQRLKLRHMNERARPLFVAYLVSFVAAIVIVLTALAPGWERGALILLAFLNWQPHWENMEGPGIETFLLMLMAASLALLKAGRSRLAGVALGVAGALKVYPWGSAFLFLFCRKGWKVWAGMLAGTLLAFAVTSFVVPVRISVEYFLRILPRVGGASGVNDNLSAIGNFSRMAYKLRGERSPAAFDLNPLTLLERFPSSWPDVLTLVLWSALSAFLLIRTLRGLKRTLPARESQTDMLRLAMSICLIVLLMATVWSAYQTILLVPLAVGIALAPRLPNGKRIWGLLLLATGAGAINIGDASQWLVIITRSIIPLAIWMACLRLLEAAGSAPCSRTPEDAAVSAARGPNRS